MGIFSADTNIDLDLINENELLEEYIFDEISRMSDESRKIALESDEMKALEEAGRVSRRTLVRLSKQDDLTRRMGMAALKLAKDKDDPLFIQLTKVRIKERELLDKINAKYSNKATKVARMGQKEFLKQKLPLTLFRK